MAAKPRGYRIFIAEEHPIMRKGLSLTLFQNGWNVVGEAGTGAEAVADIRRFEPDLAILAVQMRDLDGLEALKEIKASCPQVAVLIYTAAPVLENLIKAVEYGAAGFLLKSAPEEELVDQVRRIAAGECILDAQWRRSILREIQARALEYSPEAQGHSLSPRELEILQAIGAGLTTAEIAEVCGLSVHTVSVHVRHILKKLQVSDRTQAIVWAARRKLVTFD